MKILHLCGNYVGNKLFSVWFPIMGSMEIEQNVFIPLKYNDNNRKYEVEDNNLKLHYRKLKTNSDLVMYFKKIGKYYEDLNEQKLLEEIDCIHAHMLFTDAGVAYKAHLQYGIPYILAIRDTDINFFMKYFIHTRKYIKKVLLNAEKIILISPSYKKKLFEFLTTYEIAQLDSKIEVIPNGLSPFWIKNRVESCHLINEKNIKLIQVSKLDKRKNITTTIKVVKELKNRGYKAELIVVGKGAKLAKCLKLAKKMDVIDQIIFTGELESAKLLEYYKNSDIFIMPSITETFGNVYIEAMSQSLPLIYTRNQGFDGFFTEGEIGESVNAYDVNEISDKVIKIHNNYEYMANNCIKYAPRFDWIDISKRYFEIYQSISK